MKRFLKWILVVVGVVLLCGVVFRGFIYRQLFHYQPIGQRTIYNATRPELIRFIDDATSSFKPEGVEHIVEKSLALTSERLQFRAARNDNDPDKLIRTTQAHCVGYSAFFSAVCNYLLEKYGYSESWSSKPLIGQIYVGQINIHQFASSSFFRDHDFNVIENHHTGERYYVDPTLRDYFYIDYVTGGKEIDALSN